MHRIWKLIKLASIQKFGRVFWTRPYILTTDIYNRQPSQKDLAELGSSFFFQPLVTPAERERNDARSVGGNETPIWQVKRSQIGKPNYPILDSLGLETIPEAKRSGAGHHSPFTSH